MIGALPGFALLAMLATGVVLVALSLPALLLAFLLGIAALLFPPALILVTSILVPAGIAFAIGMGLVLVGSLAFAFPAVQAFLGVLRTLLQLLARLLPSVGLIGTQLRLGATLLETAGSVLKNTAAPAFDGAGGALEDAAAGLPDIPSVAPATTRLWMKIDSNGQWETDTGLLPHVPPFNLLVPDTGMHVVTGVTVGDADASVLETALVSAGTTVRGIGANTSSVGTSLEETGAAVRLIADVIDPQP